MISLIFALLSAILYWVAETPTSDGSIEYARGEAFLRGLAVLFALLAVRAALLEALA